MVVINVALASAWMTDVYVHPDFGEAVVSSDGKGWYRLPFSYYLSPVVTSLNNRTS